MMAESEPLLDSHDGEISDSEAAEYSDLIEAGSISGEVSTGELELDELDSSEELAVKSDTELLERELTEERDQLLDTLKRLQADFENYKKRVLKQEFEIRERANVGLIAKLLPVLDVMELADKHLSDSSNEEDGGEKVLQMLKEILEKEGLERVGNVDEAFDPSIHEAVAHSAESDSEVGLPVVAEVYRSGYKFRGKILRPAMVTVKG